MRRNDARSRSIRRIITFYLLVYGFSLLLYVLSFIFQENESEIISTILRFIGGAGPLVGVLYMIFRHESKAFRKDYWRRIIDFKRIDPIWYLLIIGLPVIANLTAIILDIIINGRHPAMGLISVLRENVLLVIPLAVFYVLFGPLPEEMAWRGYALEKLQRSMDPLRASLILGLLWAVWHIPLFFLDNTYQKGLGLGTERFALYMLTFILQAVIMTWIFNSTRGSILSAILFHFAVNFSGEMYDISIQAEYLLFVTWIIICVIVIAQGKMWKDEGWRDPN